MIIILLITTNKEKLEQKAIDKDREKVKVDLRLMKGGEKPPTGHEKIKGHWFIKYQYGSNPEGAFCCCQAPERHTTSTNSL